MASRRTPLSVPGLVREVSPHYAAHEQSVDVFHVSMGERGRLVLPAEIRERLGIRQGDELALILEVDGTISIKTRDVALNDLQGSFKHLAPTDHFASDDLIAERRREADADRGSRDRAVSGSRGKPRRGHRR
jgi:AbrB family looped-hinge helix DNA binding protein